MKFSLYTVHVPTDNAASAFCLRPDLVSSPSPGFEGITGTFFTPTTPLNVDEVGWSRGSVKDPLLLKPFPYDPDPRLPATEAVYAELGFRALASLSKTFQVRDAEEVCFVIATSEESVSTGRKFFTLVIRSLSRGV